MIRNMAQDPRPGDVSGIARLQWLTTKPSGRAHTHSADDGQTGWRVHAVMADPQKRLENLGKGRTAIAAACGLRPRNGWSMDLFIEDKCKRCESALAVPSQPAEPVCAECQECARHAYSDSTTPGFFRDQCAKHYQPAEEKPLTCAGCGDDSVRYVDRCANCGLLVQPAEEKP